MGAKGEDVPATRLTFKRQEIESVACLKIAVAPDRLHNVKVDVGPHF